MTSNPLQQENPRDFGGGMVFVFSCLATLFVGWGGLYADRLPFSSALTLGSYLMGAYLALGLAAGIAAKERTWRWLVLITVPLLVGFIFFLFWNPILWWGYLLLVAVCEVAAYVGIKLGKLIKL